MAGNAVPLSYVFPIKLLYLRKNNTAVLELGRLSRCKLGIQPRDLGAHARAKGFQGHILNLGELNSFLSFYGSNP